MERAFFAMWVLCLSACQCRQQSNPNTMRGTVKSPQYPQPYPPNHMQQWHLWAPEGLQIQLHLIHLDIRSSPNCTLDSLKIEQDNAVMTKICGYRDRKELSARPIATQGNQLKLIFQTSDFKQELHQQTGFLASYKKVDVDECSQAGKGNGPAPLCSQICVNTFGSYYCSCHSGYRLQADHRTCSLSGCMDPEPLLNGGVTLLSGSDNRPGSVIQYHCNEPFYSFPWGENVTFTCGAERKWTSVQGRPLTCSPVCGKPTSLFPNFGRILGGREAPADTIPWHVLLNIEGMRVGGVVIGERWVMTAAHDLTHGRRPASNVSVQVHLAHTSLKTLLKSPVLAASVHIHPDYNNSQGLYYDNDIALIQLPEKITFKSEIMPLCLPAENPEYITGMMGVASGFGLMDIYPPRTPKSLRYVELPVVDQETCRQSFAELKKLRDDVPNLTDNMFCVGLPEGGRGSCLGDKGGPFTLRDNSGRFWAAGIDSWGVDCGIPGTYRVYTKVGNYVDWIKTIIHENEGLEELSHS